MVSEQVLLQLPSAYFGEWVAYVKLCSLDGLRTTAALTVFFSELLECVQAGSLAACFSYIISCKLLLGFPGGSVVESPPANAGDTGDAVWYLGYWSSEKLINLPQVLWLVSGEGGVEPGSGWWYNVYFTFRANLVNVHRDFEFISPSSESTQLPNILLMGLIYSCVIFSYPFLRVSFVTEELEDIEEPQRVWK